MAETSDQKSDHAARLAIIGDVMLGRSVSDEIRHRNPDSFWGDVLPIMRRADAVVANLECAISDRGIPWTATPKVFHFRAIPAAIDVLKAGNVRYVSLANNHILDFGEDALGDTLRLLDGARIAHAGVGQRQAEACSPARFTVNGLSISAFSIVDHEAPFAAKADQSGTCFIDLRAERRIWPDAAAIRKERASGADVVLVSAHLGPNMVQYPGKELQDFKKRLLVSGVDIIHGHSAHVFQGIQAMGRQIILHDTGDFLDDYATDSRMRNDWSFLFLLDVDATGVRHLLMRPVKLGFASVNLAVGDEFTAICDRMLDMSAAFGTELQRCDEGLELYLARK